MSSDRATRSKTSKQDQDPSVARVRVVNDDGEVQVFTLDGRVKKSANVCSQGCTCQVCDDPDTTAMVQCDECDKWSHFACVGVTQGIENQSWVCHKCQPARKTQQKESTPDHRKGLVSSKVSDIEERTQNPKSSSADPAEQQKHRQSVPKVVVVPASKEAPGKTKQSTGKPASSKASSQSWLKLQLMKLEEERAFEEAQAKKYRDYLKEKYELLEKMSNQTGSSHSESSSRLNNWVEEVSDLTIAENLARRTAEPFDPSGHSTVYGGTPSVNPPNQPGVGGN